MKRFKIIKVDDPKWSELIFSSNQYDFYHTCAYSSLELSNKNEPLLCVAYWDKEFIALPIVVRKIEGTDFFDCTSVYGYCGPVSSLSQEDISSEYINYFQSQLLSFFKERKIVSAFSRLHPIMDQSIYFSDFGTVKDVNNTVAINLRLTPEEQAKQYRKSHKYEIKQLYRWGFKVTEAVEKTEIDLFIQLYIEAMKSKNADPYYYFPKEYFYLLLNNSCFRSKLLLIKYENKIAAGAIFTLTKDFMQYHLAVSNQRYRKYAPMKLLLDAARFIGIENNIKYLHLGGGINGKSDDSLFRFKAGFSEIRFMFKVWQLIVDEYHYHYLIDRFGNNVQNQITYFPAYRAK